MMTLAKLLDDKGRRVHAIRPEEPVLEAVRRMAEHHIGALLVMEGEAMRGIVSERDYARKVVLMGRSSAATPIRDIMSSPVISIGDHASVEDAMREMTERRIRHLPVMHGTRVDGIVSIGDLVKCVIEDQRHLIEDLQTYIRG